MRPYKLNWDALGISASIACAIHCAVLPLAVASLPVFGVDIIDNLWFEYGMIGLAFLIGTRALAHGFRRHHRSFLPWLLFAGGILLLLAKQLWHERQFQLLPFAVALIIGAHCWNYRLSAKLGRPRPAPGSRPQFPGGAGR